MKLLSFLLLTLALGVAAADPLPDRYRIILKRNVFDATRTPQRVAVPERPRETPPPAPPPKQSATLVGVVIVDGEPTAILSGSGEALSGTRSIGGKLAGMAITAIDLGGITVAAVTGELRLPVGAALSGREGEAWTVDRAPAATPSASAAARPATSDEPAAATSTSPATPAAEAGGGGESDLIRRMRERRQREMQP